MHVDEVVVEMQQHHEREEHRESREEVPDVVRVEEVQEFARPIVKARLRRRQGPRYRFADEKVEGRRPSADRQDYVDERPQQDLFAMAHLHDNVEERVEQ